MDFYACDCGALRAWANISCFKGHGGADEYHLMVHPTEYGSFETQLKYVFEAYLKALESVGLDMKTSIMRRFFCSDLVNQAALLEANSLSNSRNGDGSCAVSWVCQPPSIPAKTALWAYHVKDRDCEPEKTQAGPSFTLRRGRLAHHWTTGITCSTADTSYGQTQGILQQYETLLKTYGLSLADNVIRTWFFVQDVDANYQGLVRARREFFAERGLTKDTHFVASTGVGGGNADIAAKVTMDAYAVSGLRPEQITFLAAPDHLSPTHIYGVTFERGTSVSYRDRKHVILSGTASVDRDGRILHAGDVLHQLERTIENMQALLAQAGAGLKDMCMLIVYVRDPGDQAVVRRRMRERFGDVPMQITAAAVCRPGWLVEVEGTAIIPESNPELPAF
jgi:enamine deaminase RidA (YjgF/YER057c/UK114 family)